MSIHRPRFLAVVLLAAAAGAAACGQSPPAGQVTNSTTNPVGTAEAPTDTTTTTTAEREFAYQPLWPFADADEAAAWQDSYRTSGHQPWHLDAEETAVAFTTGYLGFAEIDQALSSDVDGDEAWVTVGYAVEQSDPGPAAVVHLARIGTGDDAPWEVVGTRDTTLTLTEPRYGTTITTPVTVGGQVTGIDESIRVQVRKLSGVLGESCCLAAGGENTPWTTAVSYEGADSAPLTIVASTGGHVADVERFAITGVRHGA
ncbi:hypothetical protein [Actinophytocola algeriensis]|uniref:Uncharacterized protein n=1 Tax=Actinophytocola algeriensis TaxID=1768010 RepID=A0A7W7QCA7_9PSEU|nr:hypothetical protein [Actinophytocola algeriensis]MBB4911016.1 hypothetical protein [Actinophytocola algeriensis]MBE1474009.1 hypothetical protein [Actinophytocola algeriensis]